MKTLTNILNETCKPCSYALNEAFSSTIIANLHKNNPEVMNQFFRSLVKYNYSVNGLNDNAIGKLDINTALKENSIDYVKVWIKGTKAICFTIGNSLIDKQFNWNTKKTNGPIRNNDELIGDSELIRLWREQGDTFAKDHFTNCYLIPFDSLKVIDFSDRDKIRSEFNLNKKFKFGSMIPTELKSSYISKMTPEMFYSLFEGKTLIWYMPVSVFNRDMSSFKDEAKNSHGLIFPSQTGTLMLFTNITNKDCKAMNIKLDFLSMMNRSHTYQYSTHTWTDDINKRNIPLTTVINALSASSFKKFIGSKFFVVDEKTLSLTNNDLDECFGGLLAPITEMIKDYNDTKKRIVDIVATGKEIEDITKLRKGTTWNYAVVGASYDNFDLSIVGYDKGFKMIQKYNEIPLIDYNGYFSIAEFHEKNVIGQITSKGLSGYKINPKQYDSALAIAKTFNSETYIKKYASVLSAWKSKHNIA